jgi:hypothetical protein
VNDKPGTVTRWREKRREKKARKATDGHNPTVKEKIKGSRIISGFFCEDHQRD